MREGREYKPALQVSEIASILSNLQYLNEFGLLPADIIQRIKSAHDWE